MANPHRGEVAFQVGEASYTLSLSINAMCELEEELGQPIAKIAQSMVNPEDVRMSWVRALIWAALRDHHPDVDMKRAGEIATDAGVASVMEAVGNVFAQTFVKEKDTASPRPRKAVRT